MKSSINDFVINVATVNGSGSQSSNSVLVRALFRMGIPVNGKNWFPSNIAGLPTWFTIRINQTHHLSRQSPNDLVVAMNAASIVKDIEGLSENGVFIYNSDLKFDQILLRKDVVNIGIPFKKIVSEVTDSVKLKKLLANMVYVGVLAELMGIDHDTLKQTVDDQFKYKDSVVAVNLKAIDAGIEYTKENLEVAGFPFKVQTLKNGNQGKVLIDGNSAAAMGFLFGGCTFMSWYPITPSSSVPETFQRLASSYRKDKEGKNNFAVVQAEDELSAISMVIGAGWAGARAATATSGPGLSLMAEAAGLSYFAEVPAVIWNVQRGGPSTGLPTRTMQGDLLAAARLSHGDTKHPVLIPGTPKECFEFAQASLDLSERLQTLVIVLSDLDLGMNQWITDGFDYPTKPFDRGKVLDKEDLDKLDEFARYKDTDGDGIPYRTLPGTHHPNAAYFTRGTGHDEHAKYTEDSATYRDLLDRLNKKFDTAHNLVPKPLIERENSAKIGIIAYGTSDFAAHEAREFLAEKGLATSYLRVRAYPFADEVQAFIDSHDTIYIVEQNRDDQLRTLIQSDLRGDCSKLRSVLQYDGLPLEASYISSKVLNGEGLQ